MRKRAIWQPLPKGGRGEGNIIFFLEAQFTPLSPDISPISVSQTVNFQKNKNWNNRGIPRDRVLKSYYFEKKFQLSLTCPMCLNYDENENENETRGNLLSVYFVKSNKF